MTRSIKRDAASGLVVLVPLIVTAWTLWWLYNLVADAPLVGRLAPLIPGLRALHDFNQDLAHFLLTLVLFAVLLFGLTYVMRTAFGAVVESRLDDAVNQVPIFRVVYNASKIAVETAVSEEVELQAPVKLFLWGDTRVTAFRTGSIAPDGRTTVYVPASPVIFTGWIVEVDEERVIDTDESVENALMRVISAGFANRKHPEDLEGDTGIGSRSVGQPVED